MKSLIALLAAVTGVARADEPASHRHTGVQMTSQPAHPSLEGMFLG
jgi:hypothetical protein